MKTILTIMKICNVDRYGAARIFARMSANGVDPSTCSTQMFRREAKKAADEVSRDEAFVKAMQ
jgi:hypothetical protein